LILSRLVKMDSPFPFVIRFLLAVVAGTQAAGAEDWPHWRGPSRNGIVDEDSGWRQGAWPPEDAEWTARVGEGGTAPIVAEGRLYTLGSTDQEDHVYCLDAATGREVWKSSYKCARYGRYSEGDKGLYSGPSACPSFDPDTGLLFTLSTDGDLNCWDTRDQGARVWGMNLYDEFGVGQRPLVGTRRRRDYGYTTSPLVHRDWVIVEVGDDEGNLMAFLKRSGRRQWTSESQDPAGHTGGLVPMIVEEIPCVAVLTIHNLLVVRLDAGHEGETLAEFPWETDFANNIATPTVRGDSVVITSEYNQYSICRVRITREGAQQVWKQPYASGVSSPIIYAGHVYWGWRGVFPFPPRPICGCPDVVDIVHP